MRQRRKVIVVLVAVTVAVVLLFAGYDLMRTDRADPDPSSFFRRLFGPRMERYYDLPLLDTPADLEK